MQRIERVQPARGRRVVRWSLRGAAVLGCVLALGAGYALAAGGIGSITVFSTGLPGDFSGYAPSGIAGGSDGAVWFSGGNTNPNPLIGRISPSGTISEFSSGLTPGSDPEAMTEGPDGNVWFADTWNNEIGRVTTAGTITEFPVAINGQGLKGIAAGPDGNVWFTNGGLVGKITPSGQITEYSSGLGPSPQLLGITAGTGNTMWFVDAGSPGAIGKITTDGTITEYKTPADIILNSESKIAQGPDGNLWFTVAKDVVRMTPDAQFSEFPPNFVPKFLNAIAPGPDGNMWFTDLGADKLGMITPAGVVSDFDLSASGLGYANSLTTGPDGDLWLTGGPFAAPSIAKVDVGAPAASVTAPAISGSGQVGDEESCGGAVWADWAGEQPSITASSIDGYQWLLDGEPLAGQTTPTYIPTASDAGHLLACKLTATYTLFPTIVSATSTAVTVLPIPTVGGGGGGGGGSIPDLAVTLGAPAQVPAGGQAAISLAVSDLNGASASGIHAIVTLPEGTIVDSASSDRGSGCTTGAAAGTVDCNLDFLSGSLVAHATITLTLPNPGQATLNATVSDAQGDMNNANNTASATVQVGSTTTTTAPAAPSPPSVKKNASAVTILGVKPVQLGRNPKLHLTIKASRSSEIVVTLVAPSGKAIARWTAHVRGGITTITLALPAKARHKGRDELRIQAGSGKATTVAVVLRV